MANSPKKTTDSKNTAKAGGKRAVKDTSAIPFRRELLGLVFFFLSVFSLFGFFQTEAIFIQAFAILLKGCLGIGFWLCPPAFLYASYVSLFHRGQEVIAHRVACSLLLPLFFSCLSYGFIVPANRPSLTDVVNLWNTGRALSGCGVLGSIIGGLVTFAFTGVGTILIFTVFTIFLVLGAIDRSVMDIIDWYATRPSYEPKPVPEKRATTEKRLSKKEENQEEEEEEEEGEEEESPKEKKSLFSRFFTTQREERDRVRERVRERVRDREPEPEPQQVAEPVPVVEEEPQEELPPIQEPPAPITMTEVPFERMVDIPYGDTTEESTEEDFFPRQKREPLEAPLPYDVRPEPSRTVDVEKHDVFTAWDSLKVSPSNTTVPDPLSSPLPSLPDQDDLYLENAKASPFGFFNKEKTVPPPDEMFPSQKKETAVDIYMEPVPVEEDTSPEPLMTLPAAELPVEPPITTAPKQVNAFEIQMADDPSMRTVAPVVESPATGLEFGDYPNPVEQTPVQAPIQQNPVVQTPVQAPIQQNPVEQTPVQAPLQQNPVEQAPVQAPIQQNPVEQTPVQAPIQQNPVEQTAMMPPMEPLAPLASMPPQEALTYKYPPLELLNPASHSQNGAEQTELQENRQRLEDTIRSFNIEAHIKEVTRGPSVTRYELELVQGVKLSKLTNLSDDIALALGATGVRIAPIPDKISMVGIEVPNKAVTPVEISAVIGSANFRNSDSKISFSVGKDISGNAIVGNIGKMPHLLVAGTTGSGKSVCTNSLIISLLYKASPEEVRLIMVDPKMVELGIYNGIPHLLIPVVTDPKKAAGALQWAVTEMMKRYRLFSEVGTRDLASYNQLAESRDDLEKMPQIVVVIDELADLMLVAAKEVEESICRVAQMGRASGMHLIIATQRPSADVITGLMKANIPSRISFAVSSGMESRIILDTQGAEKLVGRGDMLYAPLGEGKPSRVQGCFISDAEVAAVVNYVKKESGIATYSDEIMEEIDQNVAAKEKGNKGNALAPSELSSDDKDEMLDTAIDTILETGQASVSMLQRRLKLGYARAARIVDQIEEMGIVGASEGSKARQVLISKEQWQEMKYRRGATTDPTPPQPTATAEMDRWESQSGEEQI